MTVKRMKKGSRSKQRPWLGKILVGGVGSLLVLYALSMPLLWVVGEVTTGQVTVVRRELGDRQDPLANRYSWAIGFEFALPDGRVIPGNTKRIGDAQSAGLAKGTHRIRYLAVFPYLNALEEEARPSLGHLILIGVGALLLGVSIRMRA